MINFMPQCLEFFLIEIVIQRIVLHLGFMTIREHILQNTVIINCLNQRMNTFCHWLQVIRQIRKSVHCNVRTVFVCNLAISVHITVLNQIEFNIVCFAVINQSRNTGNFNILAFKVFIGCNGGSIIKDSFNIGL